MKTCGRCIHKGLVKVMAKRTTVGGKSVAPETQEPEEIEVPGCLKGHSLKGVKWKCPDYKWNRGVSFEERIKNKKILEAIEDVEEVKELHEKIAKGKEELKNEQT